jgi:hypothetical protein
MSEVVRVMRVSDPQEGLNDLGEVLLSSYMSDPESLTSMEKGLMFGLQMDKHLDALEAEQYWLWKVLAPAMRKINKMIDDYQSHRPNRILKRFVDQKDFEYLEEVYSQEWFDDLINNLRKRTTIFEKALGHDLYVIRARLVDVAHPDWRKEAGVPEYSHSISRQPWLDEENILWAGNNFEYFLQEQAI